MEENFVFCDQSGVGLCIIGLSDLCIWNADRKQKKQCGIFTKSRWHIPVARFWYVFALVYHTCILFLSDSKSFDTDWSCGRKRWKRNCTSQEVWPDLTGRFFTHRDFDPLVLSDLFLSAGIKIEKIRKTNRKKYI